VKQPRRTKNAASARKGIQKALGYPWLPMRSLILAALASVVLIVIAEVGLGWSLDAEERSFVVLLVLLVVLASSWIRTRMRGDHDERK